MEIYEQLTHYKFGTKNWFSSVCNPHTKVDIYSVHEQM